MKKDYELQAQRRARKVQDIKTMFQQLTNQGVPNMEAYERVGWYFYLSETEIRHIIAGRR